MKKKFLVILDHFAHINKAKSALKSNGLQEIEKACFIAFDASSYVWLRNIGIEARLCEEYLSLEERRAIDKAALAFANSWYCKDTKSNEEYLDYRGYSLGNLVEYELIKVFVEALLLLEESTKLISKENPDCVLIDVRDSAFVRAVSNACFKKGIKLVNLSIRSKKIKPQVFLKTALKNTLGAILGVYCRLILYGKKGRPGKNILFGDPRRMHQLLAKLREKRFRIIFKYIDPVQHLGFLLKGYRYFSLDGLLSWADKLKINLKVSRFKKEAKQAWQGLSQNKDYQAQFKFNQAGFWDLLEVNLRQVFLKLFPLVASDIEKTETFLKKYKASIFISIEDRSPALKTPTWVCKCHNVPTLTIQNGATGPKGIPASFVPVSADKIAVWGRIAKDWLVSLGVNEEKIAITGSHLLDKYYGLSPDNGSIGKGKYILLATQLSAARRSLISYYFTVSELSLIYRAVFEAMKNFPDYYLMLRLHPSDRNPDLYKIIARETGYSNIVLDKGDLVTSLKGCSALVTPWSTTGFEAMFLDKPVITVNFLEKEDWVPYAREGAAVGVYKEEKLTEALLTVLTDAGIRQRLLSAQKRFIENYGYKNDGRSAERITNLIEGIMKN